MRKFYLLLMLLFTLVFFSDVARAANQASFKFTPVSGTYQAGQTFSVDVQLNTDGAQVVAVSAYVLYDKTKLAAISISTSTSAFAYEVENTIDSVNGKIFITRGQPTLGVTGTAIQVARINFQALSAASAANVSFDFIGFGANEDSGAILNDNLGTDILASVTNASFVVNATSSPDTTAPSAPANISATSTQTVVTLSWSASTDNVGVVGYKIYRDNFQIATTTQLSYADINLAPVTSYSYAVSAYDAAGNESTRSNISVATQSVPDTNPPTTITNLAISDIGQSFLTLSWTAPSDASGVSSYDIRYGVSAINESNFSSATPVSVIPTPAQAGASQQQYVSVGLIPGTTYYFAVKSTDALGNISSVSNIASAITLSAPSAISNSSSGNPGTISVSSGGGGFTIYTVSDANPPSSPSNLNAVVSSAQITLSWSNPTDPDFVRTRILRKTGSYSLSQTDGTIIYEGNGSTFTDINLQNETAYYYTFYAYDSVPNFSIPAKITAAPKQITAAPTNTSVSQQQFSPYLPVGISEGALVRGPDGIKVYIVNYHGYKRHIFNPAIFNMYGHFKWDQIKTLDQQTLNSIKTSDFYRADGDTRVFSLKEINESKGLAQKRWMNISGDKFTQLGYKWEQVFIINSKERDYYQDGTPLSEQELLLIPAQQLLKEIQTINAVWYQIGHGSLIKSVNSPNVYYITDSNLKKLIPNIAVFNSYGNKWESIKVVSQDQLDSYPTVNTIRLTSSNKIYFLENNTKRFIKTQAAFQRLKLNWDAVAQVNQIELDAYPEGEPIE